MKTFKKTLAGIGLVSMLAMNVAMAAKQIGTGSINDGAGNPVTSTGIFADGNTATGVLESVQVSASVEPILNMVISTGSLDLGAIDQTGTGRSLNMEIGTNAANGVRITAKSNNGGLTSETASGRINSLDTSVGGYQSAVGESYTFSSVVDSTSDSSYALNAQGRIATEINTTTDSTVIYSTDRPERYESIDDLTFTVFAQTTAETAAASDYSDTITFTVVGSF